ncbi:MAG: nucleotide exchange factor GrpE [Clostridia bacterium]|nr:nucleotide exchange factor GrpE [Clostridia bacterium]
MAENLEEYMEHEEKDGVSAELLNSLKEKLESQKAEIDEKEDRIKRLMAEFDNFKKRSAKEREGLYNTLVSDIAISLLPVIDNLEKAVSVKTEDNNYKIGVELVLKQFKDVLKSNGINEIEAVGKTFDPELHEAVSTVDDPELGSQEIKEEYRKGYKIGDKVIRHSLVVVAN